jgi:hypothetical protein
VARAGVSGARARARARRRRGWRVRARGGGKAAWPARRGAARAGRCSGAGEGEKRREEKRRREGTKERTERENGHKKRNRRAEKKGRNRRAASAPIAVATAVGRPRACVVRTLREKNSIAPALIAESSRAVRDGTAVKSAVRTGRVRVRVRTTHARGRPTAVATAIGADAPLLFTLPEHRRRSCSLREFTFCPFSSTTKATPRFALTH